MKEYIMKGLASLLIFQAALCMAAENKSILFTGTVDSGMHHLVDPKVKEKLEADGWKVASAWNCELTREMLAKFNVVVIVSEGKAAGQPATMDKTAHDPMGLIRDFVKFGGGVFCFFNQHHYSKDLEYTLNQLITPMGASVSRETFKEYDEKKIHRFELQKPTYYHSIRTKNIFPHKITKGVKEFWLGQFLGVLKTDDKWSLLVKGEKTLKSSKTYPEAPPVMAARDWGKGRAVILACFSSFYLNDGYHRFYDNGWHLEQGDGWKLFSNALNWLTAPSMKTGSPGGYKTGELPPLSSKGGWKIVEKDILKELRPFRGIFGIRTTYSGGLYTVKDFADLARKLKLDFIAVTDEVRTKEKWEQLVADCKVLSGDDLVVMPGVVWKDKIGNKGYAVNIEKWPPDIGITNLNHIQVLLRTSGKDYSGIYIFTDPKSNPSRPWETGGFSALETVSKRGEQVTGMAADMLEEMQAYPGMSILPVVSGPVWTLNQMKETADKGFGSYLMAPSLKELRRMPSWDLTPGFITSGPVLDKFSVDHFSADTWENYYLWQTGDIAVLNLELSSESKIKEVKLMSGTRIVRKFFPDSKVFTARVELPMVMDGPFYVVAKDQDNGILISYAIPTRNLNFWNHVGSDRMNDYHNPVLKDKHGSIIYKGERYGTGGLITLAFGWGNYLRTYNPSPSSRYAPQGYETGSVNAGLKNLNTYPTLAVRGMPSGAVEPVRLQKLSTRDVVVIDEIFPRVRKTDKNGTVKYFDLKAVEAKTRLIIFRPKYKPFGYSIIYGKGTVRLTSSKIVAKTRNSDLAIQFAGLTFKGNGRKLKELNYRDLKGETVRKKVSFLKKWKKKIELCKGGYVTLTPITSGLLGFFTVDGPMTVDVISGGHPKINAGLDMKNGKRLLGGSSYECRWITVQEGGGEDHNLFEKLARLWGLGEGNKAPVYAPRKLTGGRLLQEPYIVTIESKSFGCAGDFSSADDLPNGILPVMVKGVEKQWSAGAVNLKENSYYPGGVLEGDLLIGLEKAGTYFLGNPLVCDNAKVRIEILNFNKNGISWQLHNPNAETVKCKVAANKNIRKNIAEKILSLEAGEIRKITCKWIP